MIKTKLIGSRIVDNVDVPKIPNVIILNDGENLNEVVVEEGDLFDANSIRKAILSSGGGSQPQRITNMQIDELFN